MKFTAVLGVILLLAHVSTGSFRDFFRRGRRPVRVTYGGQRQSYGPAQASYGHPAPTYGAPIKQIYSAPHKTAHYGAPQGPVQVVDSYGSPHANPVYKAPHQDSYGAPHGKPVYKAPHKDSYGAPHAKPVYKPAASYAKPVVVRKPTYSAPKPHYGPPKPSYHSPKPSYHSPKKVYSALFKRPSRPHFAPPHGGPPRGYKGDPGQHAAVDYGGWKPIGSYESPHPPPSYSPPPHETPIVTVEDAYASPVSSYVPVLLPHGDSYGAPEPITAAPSYTVPPKPTYSKPEPTYKPEPSYVEPHQDTYDAPHVEFKDQYVAPHAEPHKDLYGAPHAEPNKDSYGAPHAQPHKESYGAPHAEPHQESYVAPHAEPHKESYVAPKPSYGPPKPSYGPPKPSYKARRPIKPRPSYNKGPAPIIYKKPLTESYGKSPSSVFPTYSAVPHSSPIEEPLFDNGHVPYDIHLSPPGPGKYQATKNPVHLAEDNQSGTIYVQDSQPADDLYYIFYEEDDTVIEPHVTQPHEGPHAALPTRTLQAEDFRDTIYYQSPQLGFVRTKKRVESEAGLLQESLELHDIVPHSPVAPREQRELDGSDISESSAHYHIEVDGKEAGFEHSIDHTKNYERSDSSSDSESS